jgi:WD40 repeat protein
MHIEALYTLKTVYEYGLDDCCLSPDGTYLAIRAFYEVHIIDLRTGQHIRTLDDHIITCATFSPWNALVTGTAKSEILIWNSPKARRYQYAGCNGHVVNIAFRSLTYGSPLVAGHFSNDTVIVWDVNTGTLFNIVQHISGITSIAFVTSDYIVIGTLHCVHLYDLFTGQHIRNFTHDWAPNVSPVVVYMSNSTVYIAFHSDELEYMYQFAESVGATRSCSRVSATYIWQWVEGQPHSTWTHTRHIKTSNHDNYNYKMAMWFCQNRVYTADIIGHQRIHIRDVSNVEDVSNVKDVSNVENVPAGRLRQIQCASDRFVIVSSVIDHNNIIVSLVNRA